MTGSDSVELVAVDEAVLSVLVEVARTEADPDEVTPPVTAGRAWTPERLEWLRAFHRERRPGWAGPARERTWAVRAGDRIIGSVRLQQRGGSRQAEIGVWIARSDRRDGRAGAAIAALLDIAVREGITDVVARTTSANVAALAVLQGLSFELAAADEQRSVVGSWRPPAAPPPRRTSSGETSLR